MTASLPDYPPDWPMLPFAGPVQATVTLPGSKSISNRALVLAGLCHRTHRCTLSGLLHSEDTAVMLESLRRLGIRVAVNGDQVVVGQAEAPTGPLIPATQADLFVANSGTTMRFLTAFVALGEGSYRLDGIARMRERPIGDLLHALRQLGVHAISEAGTDCPPVRIEAHGLAGGTVAIRGEVSSQFLSGLLMAAPLAQADTTIELIGELVSQPYVDMTLAMMRQWGFRVEPTPRGYWVPGQQRGGLSAYTIEPDASAASYFWAIPAIVGGRLTVHGLTEHSLQGDVRFIDALEQMGCRVERCDAGITVHGRPLQGIDIDMNAISDTVMTLAVVACFAQGSTTIRNVGHIRHKETDRLSALATELRRLGAEVVERADGLTIVPRPLRGTAVDTYNDHRMAMSLALIGLRVPGMVIRHPACVAKTYPHFFTDLERLRPS